MEKQSCVHLLSIREAQWGKSPCHLVSGQLWENKLLCGVSAVSPPQEEAGFSLPLLSHLCATWNVGVMAGAPEVLGSLVPKEGKEERLDPSSLMTSPRVELALNQLPREWRQPVSCVRWPCLETLWYVQPNSVLARSF